MGSSLGECGGNLFLVGFAVGRTGMVIFFGTVPFLHLYTFGRALSFLISFLLARIAGPGLCFGMAGSLVSLAEMGILGLRMLMVLPGIVWRGLWGVTLRTLVGVGS